MTRKRRKMTATLLHLWRLFVDPANRGLRKPGNWCVIYPDGLQSAGMSYGNACEYAAIFGGEVRKLR